VSAAAAWGSRRANRHPQWIALFFEGAEKQRKRNKFQRQQIAVEYRMLRQPSARSMFIIRNKAKIHARARELILQSETNAGQDAAAPAVDEADLDAAFGAAAADEDIDMADSEQAIDASTDTASGDHTKRKAKAAQGSRVQFYNRAATEIIKEVKAMDDSSWEEYEDMAAGLRGEPWPADVQERNRMYADYLIKTFAKDMYIKCGVRMVAEYAWSTVNGETVISRQVFLSVCRRKLTPFCQPGRKSAACWGGSAADVIRIVGRQAGQQGLCSAALPPTRTSLF
jgi:hypothetical protein